MPFARWIVRGVAIAATACVTAACQNLGSEAELPPSIDRAQDLEHQGDSAGAARVYEALASQNTGAQRNAFALRATHAWVESRSPDEAERALAMVQRKLGLPGWAAASLLGRWARRGRPN